MSDLSIHGVSMYLYSCMCVWCVHTVLGQDSLMGGGMLLILLGEKEKHTQNDGL